MKQLFQHLTRLLSPSRSSRAPRRSQKGRQPTVARQQLHFHIMRLFAWSIAVFTLLDFGALLVLKYRYPQEDITVFQTICLTTLGSMTTILVAALKRG